MRPIPIKRLRALIEELAGALKAILDVAPDADFTFEVEIAYDLDRDSALGVGGGASAVVPVGVIPADAKVEAGFKRTGDNDGSGTLTLRVSRIKG